jgi:pimeloyl-ACP methyl ester carboxylesterase
VQDVPPRRRRRVWPVIRRIWMIGGATAGLVFAGWSALAFRASADARHAAVSDDRVLVTDEGTHWTFVARREAGRRSSGLVFFPGGLVEAIAYAPLLRAVAETGHAAVLVALPRRGAFGGADDPRVLDAARRATAALPWVRAWVAGGHSRGGVVASRVAAEGFPGLGGVALLGTSHPRDVSLASLTLPVVKVLGSRDCVAELEKSDANRHLLPASTRWVVLDGANHSQFGSYGFQPGDCFATIDRARQQALTVDALLQVLSEIAR